MTHYTTYVAFASSDKLYNTTNEFIQRMRSSNPRPEPATIEQIMTLFLNEALYAFMVQPSELSGLSPNLRRVIHFTTETISKASHIAIKATVKKLNVQQCKDIAEYMDSVRRQFDGEWHVCFPITHELANTAQEGFHMAINGKRQQALPMMLDYFHNQTDTAMHWYFEKPLRLLQFGPILRKVTDIGVSTTRKAIHAVIDKVIPKLDDGQAKVSAEYALSLLKTAP